MLVTTVDILNINNGAAMRARTLIKHYSISEVFIITFFKKGIHNNNDIKYTYINLHFFDYFIVPYLFILKGLPISVAVFQRTKLKCEINGKRVFFHLLRSIQVGVDNKLKFKGNSTIDICESHSINLKKRLPNYNYLKKFLLTLEIKLLDKLENKVMSYYDKIVFITNNDLKFNAKKFTVLPNKIIVNKECLGFTEKQQNKICFIGEMTYLPNINALLWIDDFITELNYEVHVIGKVNSQINLINKEKFIFHGYVDSLQDYAKDSIASIFFSHESTGLQNKILDYLNLGIPVFTNKNVADSFFNDHPLLLIKDKDELRLGLQKLVSSEENYNKRTKEGLVFLNKYYSI
ncbi:glycosyltransferase [Flavobacteriaceae bacterium]|jgi:hypothetical protein|nr:glycosyltransferase family 4 protein [Flavobacteriaceae bacterium]MDB9901536.1 glycosyltransferase family 4 protein [Flavobacteriaceae bacterium]MDC0958387.1 glycosyltransferase [Flavobacteriaceae bacterium]